MKLINWILLIVILVSSCSPEDDLFSPDAADDIIAERDQLVNLIKGEVSSISSSNPTENFMELEVLDQLAGTRIIGMGEASHGTKEFFEMKHKMLRYFVEQHGYRGIIMEADFGECLKINEYVLNDLGNIDELLEEMHFWVWRTDEVKNMIQWMHDYNLGKPQEDKVYYLGSDCQFTDTNLELIETKISLLSLETETSIRKYSDKLNKNIFQVLEFDEDVVDNILLNSDSLILEIESHQSEIVSEISDKEYEILHQLAVICHQVYEIAKNRISQGDYNFRDLYMAENTIWWADHFGMNENFLVWAHNWHVSNVEINEIFGGSQGAHLRATLNEDYKIIGFSMAMGEANAVSSQGNIEAGELPNTLRFASLNELFYLTEKENFIWVLSEDIKNNSTFEWFDNSREFISMGALHPSSSVNYYRSINLFREYDTMIHFDISTPTLLIE